MEYHQRIRDAVNRGYYVTLCGKMFGPKGPLRVAKSGKQRYPTFSTNWGGRVYGIPVHKFVAYYRFGEASFAKGAQVRHLDGDTLNIKFTNIKVGTGSENQHDKPKEVRVRAAKAARAAQGFTPKNAKLTDADVWHIRDAYAKIDGKKAPNGFTQALADKFGISKVTINKVVTMENYPNARRPA